MIRIPAAPPSPSVRAARRKVKGATNMGKALEDLREFYRVRALEFWALAKKSRDDLAVADGYRQLARGYEILASHPNPPQLTPDRLNGAD
jgi:hypothetical protein